MIKGEMQQMQEYRVLIAMHPIIFYEKFMHKPNREAILELLLDRLKEKKLDDKFVIIIRATRIRKEPSVRQ